jgi:hypothetical protein
MASTPNPALAEQLRVHVEQALVVYLSALGPFVQGMQRYRSLRADAGISEAESTMAAFSQPAAAFQARQPVTVRVPPNERVAGEVTALEQAKRACTINCFIK